MLRRRATPVPHPVYVYTQGCTGKRPSQLYGDTERLHPGRLIAKTRHFTKARELHAAPSQATAAQLASMPWFIAPHPPNSVASDRTEMDVDGSASQYLRAAWIPKLGKNWEAGIGFGIYNGKTHTPTTDISVPAPHHRNA